MTDYYIRITDEAPLEEDEALWFKLNVDGGEDNFFVLRENPYNELVDEFDAVINQLSNSEALQSALTILMNSENFVAPKSTDAQYIKNFDTNEKYSFSDLKTLKNNVDGKLSISNIDSSLSNSSTNPVQNKVIKAELDNKADEFAFNTLKTKTEKIESGINGWATITGAIGGRAILKVNNYLGICVMSYFLADYGFEATNERILGQVPSEYKPLMSTKCSVFNPTIGAMVDTSGNFSVYSTSTGTKNINASAIWLFAPSDNGLVRQ